MLAAVTAEDGQESTEWLEEYRPIDPVLKDPLDLYGAQARRRHQLEALLREMGLDHRLRHGTWGGEALSESTCRVIWPVLDNLADTVHARRVVVAERARLIPSGPYSDGAAYDALVELGWGHMHLPAGEVREVARAARRLYIAQMGDRVCSMLRRWESRGWVVDAA